MVQMLESAHERWFEIGEKLKISIIRLRDIRKSNQSDSKSCFSAVLTEKFGESNIEISTLIDVLNSSEINLPNIADELQGKKY